MLYQRILIVAACAALLALAQRLARPEPTPRVPLLPDDLTAADVGVRRRAAEAALRRGPDDALLGPLVAALGDRDLLVRGSAAAALFRLGPKAIEPVMATLQSENDRARASAVEIIGRMSLPAEHVVDALARALGDRDPKVRREAADVLAGYGLAAIPALRAALRDHRPDVRRAAVVAIIGIDDGARAAADDLAEMLADPDDEAAEGAALALAADGETGRQALAIALTSTSRAVRYRAAIALARVEHGAAVIDALQGLLDDETMTVRRAAAEALEMIGRPAAAAAPDLLRAQEDPDPQVRRHATLALLRIIRDDEQSSEPKPWLDVR
jgi:HEAT repeat protein